MTYLAYHFTVDPPQPGSEILTALISDFAFESFDPNEKGFIAYIKEEDAGAVDLSELKFEDFAFSVDIKKIETTNWNEEWEKNFEPVLVDDLLCIRAPFHPEHKNVRQEIVIMPKMSFGTGHHQTTRLMCKAMFETEFKNKRVLDMGCGTGILAILAKKLGANDVVGIDIDEWSVNNSIENCMNNMGAEIKILKGDVSTLANEKPFDVIIANINKNILKTDLLAYAAKLMSGGFIFLSGFFKTDADELKQVAAQFHLDHLETKTEDEWAMLVLKKN